ncbi:MAG: YhfZ family protein [Anaerorhabdus sp.]|uniref:YhfZ family protein n=1 Tax=Anaerorhabdus sp. TaxID=1872524 RepID=UPI003A8BCC34
MDNSKDDLVLDRGGLPNLDIHLFNKNAATIIYLAKQFLQMDIGDKIPTFSELSSKLSIARGTIQSSLKALNDTGAIEINPCGHVGTILVKKEVRILAQMANIQVLKGLMPIPSSKQEEAFATGLLTSIENECGIFVNMTYIPDSEKRAQYLLKYDCDFAIVSKKWLTSINKSKDIIEVLEFGEGTYRNQYSLLFWDKKVKQIQEKMTVGLIQEDSEQNYLTAELVNGKKVKYKSADSRSILNMIITKKIDVVLWNKTDLNYNLLGFNEQNITFDDEVTTAVLIIKKEKIEYLKLLREIIKIDEVKKVQKKVLEGKLITKF